MKTPPASRLPRALAALATTLVLVASCLACGAPQLDYAEVPCDGCFPPMSTLPPDYDEGGRAYALQVAYATSVMLVVLRSTGLHVVCSATFIAPDLILTAHHCAAGIALTEAEEEEHGDAADSGEFSVLGRVVYFATLDELDAGSPPGADVTGFRLATVLAVDPINDVAILRSQVYRASKWATVAYRELERGERLYAIGHHAGLTFSWIEGYVAHPHRVNYSVNVEGELTTVIQAHTGGWFGSSGAGWFTGAGELVGVMCSIGSRQPALSILAHWEHVRALMATLERKK